MQASLHEGHLSGGEALPSIASVSHFILRTRARGQQSGTEIRVNGGVVASDMEVGAAEGTAIEVNDYEAEQLPGASGEGEDLTDGIVDVAVEYQAWNASP